MLSDKKSDGKILIADDDEAIQLCMEEIAEQERWTLIYANNGEECLYKITEERPALVVLDQRMPKYTGEQVLEELEARGEQVPIILISAEKDLSRFNRFPSIVRIFNKPFDLEQFVLTVNERLPLN